MSHFESTLGRRFPGGGYTARLTNVPLFAAPGREVIPPCLFKKYAFCGFAKMTASNVIVFVKIRCAQIPMCKNSLPSGSFGESALTIPKKKPPFGQSFRVSQKYFASSKLETRSAKFRTANSQREVSRRKLFCYLRCFRESAQTIPEKVALRPML